MRALVVVVEFDIFDVVNEDYLFVFVLFNIRILPYVQFCTFLISVIR